MIDIHIGITNEELARARALSVTTSVPVSIANFYEIRGASNLYELRKMGYSMGSRKWVSFLDQDDLLIGVNQLKSILRNPAGKALFSNSLICNGTEETLRFQPGTSWSATDFERGIFPHNMYLIERGVAVQALETAYDRILKSDQKFLSSTDLAVAFEIQKLCGWKYADSVLYKWYADTTDSMHSSNEANTARTELISFYRGLK